MGIYINIHIYIHVHIYRYSYRRPHGEELRGVHSSRGNVHNRPSLETGNTRKMGAKYSGGGGEKQKMPTKYEENTAEELWGVYSSLGNVIYGFILKVYGADLNVIGG